MNRVVKAVGTESVFLGGEEPVTDAEVMRVEAALDGDGACTAEARRLAVGFPTRVREGHGPAVSDRAVGLTRLVVGELVTNARKYASGPILMDLRIAGEAVDVAVRDGGPALPVGRAADPGRVGRHGLEIVTAVVERFEVRREPVGKRIVARIALYDDTER